MSITPKFNLVIPMAGEGRRFQDAGYSYPKPLVEVMRHRPMIELVTSNLFQKSAQFIYIVDKDQANQYDYEGLLNQMFYPENGEIPPIIIKTEKTEGAAQTVLKAADYISSDDPLVIANCDQYVANGAIESFFAGEINDDGNVLCFRSIHPKWSFWIPGEDQNYAKEIVEKQVKSNIATTGIYRWTRGRNFVHYATKMIDDNTRVKGEFYVAPVYNYAIADGMKIGRTMIHSKSFFGLGTPEDVEAFRRDYDQD